MEKADTTPVEGPVIRFSFNFIKREQCIHGQGTSDSLRDELLPLQKQSPVVFYIKVFLKNSQNSQETSVPESLFFNKDPG